MYGLSYIIDKETLSCIRNVVLLAISPHCKLSEASKYLYHTNFGIFELQVARTNLESL